MPYSFAPEPESQSSVSPKRVQIWELKGAAPGYAIADRFVRADGQAGVLLSRWIPEEELARLLMEYPELMRVIHDSQPAVGPPLRILP